jgi:8-oxo-dGTP pyrophosphatase MutT (NUDIX family)
VTFRRKLLHASMLGDADQPEYCCALITDRRGWLLLQLRPSHARHAADQLTCFGGRRETGEDADACLRRELMEELGVQPAAASAACDCWRGRRFIARFFHCALGPQARLVTEPGHAAIWAPWQALPGLPVSPWHRQALAAIRAGRTRAELG